MYINERSDKSTSSGPNVAVIEISGGNIIHVNVVNIQLPYSDVKPQLTLHYILFL